MLTHGGVVKVLDFGLAKGGVETREGGSNSILSDSPTMHVATQAGMVLGTAAYMSPEQARGKNVDRRTDIWSFGCILFECLCGKPAFEGETISDLLARILEREPDWSALPARTPARGAPRVVGKLPDVIFGRDFDRAWTRSIAIVPAGNQPTPTIRIVLNWDVMIAKRGS